MKRLLDCSCPREVTLDVLVIVSDLSRTDKVKKPQRDLPLGIGIALSICYILCMLVSIVIVGLVPYNLLDPDTPISSAFATYGMQWAAVHSYIWSSYRSLCNFNGIHSSSAADIDGNV